MGGDGMTAAIGGFWVATPTPLTAEGGVDHAKLAGHALDLFKKGIDGVVLFGTTGEGTTFNVPERIATIEALLGAGGAPSRLGLRGGFPAVTHSSRLTPSPLPPRHNPTLTPPPHFAPPR